MAVVAPDRRDGRRAATVLIDELSFGLAPHVVDRMLDMLVQAAGRGVGVLLVEQHIHKALGCGPLLSHEARSFSRRAGRIGPG